MNYTHTTLLWQELAPLLRLISDLKMLLLTLFTLAVPILAVLGIGILIAALMNVRLRTPQTSGAIRPPARPETPARAVPVAALWTRNDTSLRRAVVRNGKTVVLRRARAE
jgi:hypothetical protein